MALKDWRKTATDGWTNDKNLKKIRIKYNPTEHFDYKLEVYDKKWNEIFSKGFVDYPEAVNYTNKYMRTH